MNGITRKTTGAVFLIRSSALIVLALLTLLVSASLSSAQSIVINDCQGFTRATRQANPGEPSKVQVQVSDSQGQPSNGVKVNMTNSISGETTEAVTANGLATFPALATGVYTLSVEQSGYLVGAIWLGPAEFAAGLATGAGILTGVAAAGGAAGVTAGVISVTDNGGGGGGTAATPTPGPVPTATPLPHPTATPCPVCNPDAEPTPINNFFKQQPTPAAQQEAQIDHRVLSPYR